MTSSAADRPAVDEIAVTTARADVGERDRPAPVLERRQCGEIAPHFHAFNPVLREHALAYAKIRKGCALL
ncbi:hypothetical protein MTR72_23830 [Bradyrhizobium sp. ISRA442]|uniref:hypothetical protein n=1 Tax=Bradyrhizobium sp. ISRA442 TaxID=2866197 RepID=UPI00311ABD31